MVNETMKCILLFTIASGCAIAPHDVQANLDSSISEIKVISLNEKKFIEFKFINKQKKTFCLSRELIDNKNTNYANINLRLNKNELKIKSGGFLAPPLTGMVRLAPSDDIKLIFRIDNRYEQQIVEPLIAYSVKIRLFLDDCEGVRFWHEGVWTGWAP